MYFYWKQSFPILFSLLPKPNTFYTHAKVAKVFKPKSKFPTNIYVMHMLCVCFSERKSPTHPVVSSFRFISRRRRRRGPRSWSGMSGESAHTFHRVWRHHQSLRKNHFAFFSFFQPADTKKVVGNHKWISRQQVDLSANALMLKSHVLFHDGARGHCKQRVYCDSLNCFRTKKKQENPAVY